jgi:hypothetical protein
MRALFVSELGAGHGNVGPLVLLAEQMSARGVQPVFALADGVTSAPLFDARSWPVLAAPALREPLRPRQGPTGYGDILASCGFGDQQTLASLVRQWDALFALVQPDVIVATHAPSAILAARGRYPVCAIGTGFTLPPHHTQTFPALRPDTVSFRPEFVALDAANGVLKERGVSMLGRLPELLNVEVRLVASVTALDPYRSIRRERYVRLGPLPKPSPLPRIPGVFAFLDVKGKEALNAIDSLTELARRAPVEAYLRGPGAPPLRGFLNRCGVRTHDRPAPVGEVFGRCSVVLSQGGHGTCLAALAGARASVVLPAHFESMLNGLSLERSGVARVAWGGERKTIDDMLNWALDVDERSLYVAAADVPDEAPLNVDALITQLSPKRAAA